MQLFIQVNQILLTKQEHMNNSCIYKKIYFATLPVWYHSETRETVKFELSFLLEM